MGATGSTRTPCGSSSAPSPERRAGPESPAAACPSVPARRFWHRVHRLDGTRPTITGVNVEGLPGCFVVESGVRQAWPFIGFCDNRPDEALEFRLYIDAPWSLLDRRPQEASDTQAWMKVADAISGLTVETAVVTGDGSLRLSFVDQATLEVSGQAGAATVGEPWWFAGPLWAET